MLCLMVTVQVSGWRGYDAKCTPPLTPLSLVCQCFSWGVYGWVRDDWSTFINNAVGVALGSIQLALIAFYGRKAAVSANASAMLGVVPKAPVEPA